MRVGEDQSIVLYSEGRVCGILLSDAQNEFGYAVSLEVIMIVALSIISMIADD